MTHPAKVKEQRAEDKELQAESAEAIQIADKAQPRIKLQQQEPPEPLQEAFFPEGQGSHLAQPPASSMHPS